MPKKKDALRRIAIGMAVAFAATLVGVGAAPGGGDEPARVSVSVTPEALPPGGEAEVTVRIVPNAGIKINRYPRIKIQVPEQEGLVLASEASVGNDGPPPPDQLETNYFKTVDPLRLALKVDPSASAGRHRVEAKLVYYYCVAASGYCAPKKTGVTIPITVR